MPEERCVEFTDLGVTQFVHDTALNTVLPQPKKELHLRSSGPQGRVEPFTIIEDPAAWKACDLQDRLDGCIYRLTEEDLEELDKAVKLVEQAGISTAEQVTGITKDMFPLPKLAPKLKDLANEASHGRGFQLIRGIPVRNYNTWQLTVMWWGIGLHIGRAVAINKFGHLVNHIRCLTSNLKEATRAPNTNIKQNMHSDQFVPGIVGLFVLSKAKEGGESIWASALTIHNELLRRDRKNLCGYRQQRIGLYDKETGKARYAPLAPYVYHEGRLSCALFSPGYVGDQEEEEVPRLTDLQLEALRVVQALSLDPQLCLKHLLEPGDIQLLNNSTMLHGREAFTEGEEPHEKRHLVRWWIDPSGIPLEQQLTKKPLACWGERMKSAAGGWPDAIEPYTVVLETGHSVTDPKSAVQYL